MEKKDSNALVVIIAFLVGMIIGMFISPVNGISIGNNNKIIGNKDSNAPFDDDYDYDEYDENNEYSF